MRYCGDEKIRIVLEGQKGEKIIAEFSRQRELIPMYATNGVRNFRKQERNGSGRQRTEGNKHGGRQSKGVDARAACATGWWGVLDLLTFELDR